MTKKYRKKPLLPSKPFSHRDTLYSSPSSHNVVAAIALCAFLAFGVGVLLEKQYIISLLPFSLAGLIAYAILAAEQKVDILEDTLYVEYLTSMQAYKADEVLAVDVQMVPVLSTYANNIGQNKEEVPRICIQLKSGKTIRIPLSKRSNVQKNILKWLDIYQTPKGDVSHKEE